MMPLLFFFFESAINYLKFVENRILNFDTICLYGRFSAENLDIFEENEIFYKI